MFKSLFFCIFCLSIAALSNAQVYQCQYQIQADSIFLKQSSEPELFQQRTIQSSMLRQFFDGMLIDIVADKDKANVTYIPKFLQEKRKDSTIIPREIVTGGQDAAFKDKSGHPDKINFMIAQSAFGNARLFDKQTRKYYLIQPHPERKVTCGYFDYKYTFEKTKKQAIIGRWLCSQWLPKEKALKGQVSIWVCDTIPQSICLAEVCDSCFGGGIVKIAFKRGFSYNLLSYSKVDDATFHFPEITQCDSTDLKTDNFFDNLIYNHIGLDFRYNFQGN